MLELLKLCIDRLASADGQTEGPDARVCDRRRQFLQFTAVAKDSLWMVVRT